MILVDTSVWIDHLRHSDSDLRQIIESDILVCHPFVTGELALGSLHDRKEFLSFLALQRQATVATHDEAMHVVERHQLFSMGIGYTDVHLLASTLIDARTELFTRDKRLIGAARKAGVRLHAPPTAVN